MAHRKHIIKKQGELVATTADPSEKKEKCLIAFQNRTELKKAKETYKNTSSSTTIEERVSESALRQLKELKGVKYFVTLLSKRKECTPFEAAEYLKGGSKVEIVEG
jgi:hypothetical protein